MDRAGLLSMAESLEQHPVRTAVSFVLRWNPSFVNTKALIDDDAIGRVYMAQIDYWRHIWPQYGQYRWSKTKVKEAAVYCRQAVMRLMQSAILLARSRRLLAYSCRTWADPNTNSIRMQLRFSS